MNRKRFYRYSYHSHPFPILLTAASTVVIAATIALTILSPMVFSRACPMAYKFSSCATVMSNQIVGVTRNFRSTKTHVAATGSGYSRFMSTVYNRQRPYVARPLGSTRRQLYETATVGLTDGKNGHANNTNTNNTRCYKIKYTTPVPTTKRWSPILKTYPQFPVTNDTVTKPDTDVSVATIATRTKITTKKIIKTTRALTTTEETDQSDETQDMAEETTSTEETTCTEETICTEETTYTEEATYVEETTSVEETTTKKKTSSMTKEVKSTTNEPTRTEKVNKTTEKSRKTSGKSNKTVKMTKITEEIDEVTCSEDPECIDEPSCIDSEETKKPTKTRLSPDQKSTAMIKQKNRLKKRRLGCRGQSLTTMYNRWSSSSLSLSSGTTVLNDSSWFHGGLKYESLKSDLTKESKLQPTPIDRKGIHL